MSPPSRNPRAKAKHSVAYYWGVVGLLIGLTLYRPAYSATALKGTLLDNPKWITFWTGFILVCETFSPLFSSTGSTRLTPQISEALNLYAHIHLAGLRQPPGKPRKYPTGWGFGVAVCANYWYEILGMLGLVALTGGDPGSEHDPPSEVYKSDAQRSSTWPSAATS